MQGDIASGLRKRNRKPRVLFVGAFKGAQAGGFVGGQLYRCQSLVDSEISDYIDWVLIDSSLRELPAPPRLVRLRQAAGRLFEFSCSMFLRRPDTVFVFLGGRPSILEKGIMLMIGKWLGCRCVCAPASGFIEIYFSERFMALLLKAVFRHSDIVVCQGRSWRDFYLNRTGLNRERFRVRPNWIDLRRYESVFCMHNGRSPIRMIYLGWLVEYKGILDLLEAIRILKIDYGVRFELDVCGDGPVMAAAIAFCEAHSLAGTVRFNGFVDFERKLDLLSLSDIFVLPSHTEGMPNALMEAMAVGLACVATDVGGVADLIPNDDFGLVVPARDPGRLAAALELMLREPDRRRSTGEAARQRIIEGHNIDLAWPEMYEILTGYRLKAERENPGSMRAPKSKG